MKNSIDENLVNQASTSLVAVLGSGGHTTEMLKLVGALSSRDYNPRTFVYANTDDMSPEKLKNLTNTNFQVTGAPVGMWTWGHVHTKFWQPP